MTKSSDGKSLFNVMLSRHEKQVLSQIAKSDDRDMANEIRWLIKAYAEGKLLTIEGALARLERIGKEPPLVVRSKLAPPRHGDESETSGQSAKG